MDKLDIHYTPKHGSWLNIAELELSHLSCQCLNRRMEDQEKLTREVAAWERRRNQKEVTVNWPFTTENARIKLKKLYPIIEESTGPIAKQEDTATKRLVNRYTNFVRSCKLSPVIF
jgi:hypothetical protein